MSPPFHRSTFTSMDTMAACADTAPFLSILQLAGLRLRGRIKSFASFPSPDRILIDVREPHEFKPGRIPGSINIPIASQPDALFLGEEEFEDRFGFGKPDKSKEVVFYCKAGVRSSAAAGMAAQAGYTKVGEYRGSWLDWEKKGGEAEK
ncbi:hypothetical protein LTR60_000513 [Cryomyces antarcticus]|nr:hypothetical protein LTR60_000513 [Cryomyces antarcticus]